VEYGNSNTITSMTNEQIDDFRNDCLNDE